MAVYEEDDIFTLAIDVLALMELTVLYIEDTNKDSKAVALKYAIFAQKRVVDYLDKISCNSQLLS